MTIHTSAHRCALQLLDEETYTPSDDILDELLDDYDQEGEYATCDTYLYGDDADGNRGELRTELIRDSDQLERWREDVRQIIADALEWETEKLLTLSKEELP